MSNIHFIFSVEQEEYVKSPEFGGRVPLCVISIKSLVPSKSKAVV